MWSSIVQIASCWGLLWHVQQAEKTESELQAEKQAKWDAFNQRDSAISEKRDAEREVEKLKRSLKKARSQLRKAVGYLLFDSD